MQCALNTISKTEKEIDVLLAWEEFSPHVEKAAVGLSKDLDVAGFRKGHIPSNIVEQKVGSSVLYNEAAELAVQATYEKALGNAAKSEAGSDSVGIHGTGYVVPEVQVTKLAPHNPFSYKVILRVPFFELVEDYKAISKEIREKERREIRVDEKEVDDTLNWFRKNRNEDGRVVQGRPDRPELKLDDDFAKSLGNFGDIDELKKSVRQGIFSEKEKREKDRVRLAVARAIIAKSSVEIPEKVRDSEVSKMEEEFKQNITQMGLEFEDYLLKIKKSKEELRDGWKDQAKERIELSLMLDTIAAKENIEPEDKKVEEESQKFLKRFQDTQEAEKSIDPVRGRSPQGGRSRASGRAASNGVDSTRLRSYIRGILRNEKVFKLLETI